ncbi:Zn(2)-C6 fungal-type domain-containing protein [Fusarium sp. LHS14.1]|nr:Zn(2)-C6 fungal-type domain-containing protein [Fusarium sp. LHS14.1]
MDYESPSPQQNAAGKRGKPSKACVPCRARKIKCDAAVTGLPCSSCVSRQCVPNCVLSARKPRRRTIRAVAADKKSAVPRHDELTPEHAINRAQTTRTEASDQETLAQTSPLDHNSSTPRGPPSRPDLHYLNILHDAVTASPTSPQHASDDTPGSRTEDDLIPRIRLWNKPPALDEVDNEFLTKKGVFDLPARCYMDMLVKTYFDQAYSCSPVIERAEFLKCYRSGNCSLFLLYAIFSTAALFAPEEAISGCGFANRWTAQEAFFLKANLLHDFHYESDTLRMLQGIIILGVIILDHPIDRDFQYWFHNAIRLAVKLDIHNISAREDASFKQLKLYRRIWWVLYRRDVFHSFVNTQNLRLLENVPLLKILNKDDWDIEDMPEESELLSPVSYQQKASLIAHCELVQIFGNCLAKVKNGSHQDVRQLMRQLDAWRASLAEKMGITDPFHGGDIYYPETLAISYRFEAIMCRLLRRCWRSRSVSGSEWAKQRLRSAIFELDTIAKRVLANGTIQKFPMTFVSTMPALLALHIETALDPSETELVRSMAKLSINQTMLVIDQVKDVPAISRALPAFEMVLSKKNLYSTPSSHSESIQSFSNQGPNQSSVLLHAHTDIDSHPGLGEHLSSYGDFLGFDFLDRWEMEQLDFTGIY